MAVGSLWSICRCKGLYVILGNIEEEKQGGGTECNSMKASEAATFFYNSGLFRVKKMECGEGWRWGGTGEKKVSLWSPGQGVSLKDSQFVFGKFLLLNKQGLSVSFWDYPKVEL